MIRTKAAVTVEELGEQYCLVGPLNESCVRTEVEILEPSNYALIGAIQHMREFGIKVCHDWHTDIMAANCFIVCSSFREEKAQTSKPRFSFINNSQIHSMFFAFVATKSNA